MEKSEQFSDGKLYKLCNLYSRRTLKWKYKFIGLLPEVYRRRLYEKKGFSSIFEFGKKLAGLSEEQIRRTLNLDKRFEENGLLELRDALVNGEVSINKLAQVASIASQENEGEVLEKSKVLPKSALETMVRDFKYENGLNKTKIDQKSVPGNNARSEAECACSLLSPEIKQKLLELQNKGINLNQLLAQFLDQRDRKIEEEKQAIVEEDEFRAKVRAEEGKEPGRYVRARTKNVLKQEFGTKCAIPHCPKPSSPLHHTDRFSLSGANNPYYLAPLCKDHHTLAHSVDHKFQQKRAVALTTTP